MAQVLQSFELALYKSDKSNYEPCSHRQIQAEVFPLGEL